MLFERRPWLPYAMLSIAGLFGTGACVFLSGGHPLSIFSAILIAIVISVVCAVRFLGWFSGSNSLSLASFPAPAFFIVMLIAGIGYSVVFTPMTSPDEDYHFVASYEWSNVLMGRPLEEMRRIDVDVLTDPSMSYYLTSESIETAGRRFQWIVDGAEKSSVPEFFSRFSESASSFKGYFINRGHISLMSSPIQTKLPSAIVLAVGRACNLGTIPLFVLGRLANVVACAALICLAYKVIPYARTAIVGLSLMPMTLHEVASYSYDAITIALAFLLTALIIRATVREEQMGIREMVSIVLVGALLAPCKIVYSLIILAVFAIPKARFVGSWQRAAFCFLAIGISFAVIGATRLASVESVGGDGGVVVASQDGQGDVTEVQISETYSFAWGLSHPMDVAGIYFKTIVQRITFLIPTFFGFSLGWFQQDITSPYWLFFALILFLLPALFSFEDDAGGPNAELRIAGAVIFIAGCALIFASMLFGHTSIGEDVIRGVQGRYFIPFALMLMASLRISCLRIKHQIIPISVLGISVVSLLYLGVILVKVCGI